MNARLPAFAIALGVFAGDQLTKLLVRAALPAWETRTIIPGFFDLLHTENQGAAFSLFSSAHPGWRTFFLVAVTAAALVIIASLLWRLQGRIAASRLLRLGLALILGGALGNLYDRVLRHGAVTDFIELYVRDFRWPAFNLADSAITIGAALVLLDMLRARRAPEPT
jgi:signal peptidase II